MESTELPTSRRGRQRVLYTRLAEVLGVDLSEFPRRRSAKRGTLQRRPSSNVSRLTSPLAPRAVTMGGQLQPPSGGFKPSLRVG